MPLLSAREATWLELVGARNLPGISSCNALWSNHLWGQRCGLGPGVVVRPGGGGQLVPSQLNCTAVRLVPLVSSAACLLCSLMSFHCEPFEQSAGRDVVPAVTGRFLAAILGSPVAE
jgi:hypothetical protein